MLFDARRPETVDDSDPALPPGSNPERRYVEGDGFFRLAPKLSAMRDPSDDEAFMRRAIALAAEAERDGDVPIGAVLAVGARTFFARNEKERRPDATAHAEILAIRSAGATLGAWRLAGATLYVTKEPCVMCAGAIVAARIARLVYGCGDPKGGAAGGAIDVFASAAANHRVAITAGVLEAQTRDQLRAFFARRRAKAE
jgi:tRNA(adenine34) deaminase